MPVCNGYARICRTIERDIAEDQVSRQEIIYLPFCTARQTRHTIQSGASPRISFTQVNRKTPQAKPARRFYRSAGESGLYPYARHCRNKDYRHKPMEQLGAGSDHRHRSHSPSAPARLCERVHDGMAVARQHHTSVQTLQLSRYVQQLGFGENITLRSIRKNR